ncbi:hypothetical protein ACSFBM_33595 [Variovorax sp. GB1R11]|uniref:hypothetical protein n=1 Tax=Variovorax sp. GB1R11 TaxID=3443741 RepID=UPI003F477C2C
MSHSSSARWLAAFPAAAAIAALATLSAVVAVAQPASANSSAASTSTPTVLTYKSALEGYQPFADEKPIPWKEANETVYRRGGWQAYAKEASGSGAAEAETPKGGAAAPAAQPGHSMPMPAMPGMSGAPMKKEKP